MKSALFVCEFSDCISLEIKAQRKKLRGLDKNQSKNTKRFISKTYINRSPVYCRAPVYIRCQKLQAITATLQKVLLPDIRASLSC